jgi:hypothetical protein
LRQSYVSSWILLLVLGLGAVAAFPSAAGAAVADGMLKAGDVGLAVVSKPHKSTVIAIDTVTSGCAPGESTERAARVVGFAENTGKPTSGAQLNQVVFDFGSASAAKSFFADMRKNEEQRVKCGTTEKATDFKLTKGPGGVGDARFSVASSEDVGGVTRKVVAMPILSGSTITELIFLDWDKSLPATTAVAKKAVTRLG